MKTIIPLYSYIVILTKFHLKQRDILIVTTLTNNNVKIKDRLEVLVPEFIKWLKRIRKLERRQTIQVSIFHLNESILLKYFPALYVKMVPHELEGEEIIYGILIMLSLKYKSVDTLSKGGTSNEIQELTAYHTFILDVFASLTMPPEMRIKEFNKLSQDIININPYLPDLSFDKEYEKVLNSRFYRHIRALNVEDVMENLKAIKKDNSYERVARIMNEKPYPSLTRFSPNRANIYGYTVLGIPDLIDDLIKNLIEYYQIRIPTKIQEIENTLVFFKELLKLVEGRLYYEISKSTLLNHLENTFSEENTLDLLDRFSKEKEFRDFNDDFTKFDANQFLNEYYEFLRYPLYYYSGIYRTGAFLIWRGILKYLELINQDEDFRKLKGEQLEKWAYQKAQDYGFDAAKLILVNLSKAPSNKYNLMWENALKFPKTLKFEFGNFKNSDSGFFEIDVAVKVEHYLFLVECKGTAISYGKYPKFIQWKKVLQKQLKLLRLKFFYINSIINKKLFEAPIFEGVDDIILTILKTEGVFQGYGNLNPYRFELMLKALRTNMDKGMLDTYITHNFPLKDKL